MTIREIAAELNISPTAVSYVLNNKPGVRKELREKITKILIQNGYSIKEDAAQDLKKVSDLPKQQTILFLYYISERYLFLRNNNVLTLYLNAIEEICNRQSCNVITKSVTGDSLGDTLTNTDGIDGVILLGIELYERVIFNRFMCRKPFVLLDGYFPESPIDSVNVDNYIGLYQAVDYLYKKGHRRIGHIKSNMPYGCLPDRWRCFYEILDYFGMPFSKNYLAEVRMQSEFLQEDLQKYLRENKDLPTVFFADNDYMAISAMAEMQQAGYSIPDDFSIIGFDNADISTLLKPNLTTISLDFRGMAAEAVQRLFRLMEQPDLPIVKSTISPVFVERESVKDLT